MAHYDYMLDPQMVSSIREHRVSESSFSTLRVARHIEGLTHLCRRRNIVRRHCGRRT